MASFDTIFFPLAFLLGMLVGLVIRGAGKRREIEELKSTIQDLKEQLDRSPDRPDAQPTQFVKPKRLTVGEFIQLLAAFAALAAAFGAGKIIEQRFILDPACETKLAYQADEIEKLLGLPAKRFVQLVHVEHNKPEDETIVLDDKWHSLACDQPEKKRLKIEYRGSSPARVDCEKGTVLLTMEGPTFLTLSRKNNVAENGVR
jgi:hypothetical protein